MTQLQSSFWQTILQRRSIRRYRPEPVPTEIIERLLIAATWAPSAHNRQPWRFVVLTTPASKLALARAMAGRWQQDLIREGWAEEDIRARIERSHQRIIQPPALILGCLTVTDMEAHDDARLQRGEWIMATQSLSLALGNLMLAAHHEGLGSCWMCAPLFAPAEVRAALDLPADWEPQALISVGFPDEERSSARKPLKEVVVWQ